MDWNRWFATGSDLGLEGDAEVWQLIVVALVGSLLTSLFVAFLYVRFCSHRGTGSEVHRSFHLLGPAVTAIFIAVQFSLPLSLGLLGALSIVRFRTPIKEAEEIGFILLVIAVSLSWATLNVTLLLVVLAVAVLGLLLTSRLPILGRRDGGGMVVVTVPADDYRGKGERLLAVLQHRLPRGGLDSIAEHQDESVISYRFPVLAIDDLGPLREELGAVSDRLSTNIFFDRSRGV